MWGILQTRWKNYAPYMAFIPCLIFSIVTNLQVRNLLPDQLKDNSYRSGEEVSLIVLIMSLLINYNSFTMTIAIFPPVVLTSHILQVSEKVNYYYDGRTGLRLSESEEEQYKWEYIFRVSVIIILFMIHHYLVLLDLSKLVIEKHMTNKQQSQLRQYV